MTAQSTDLEDNGLVLPEEDGLFARDIDGQLVRMDKVTAADFEKQITIKIDGREVTVPKAVPQTDSQGKILRDAEGRPVPRATTIYDAATKAYAGDPAGHPIPVLCHQEHLDPVGVCRVCCVEIAKVKRGSMQRERKLLPACHHRVEETMEVQTIRSPDLAARKRVDANVRTLVNLLAADHLPADWKANLPANELGRLTKTLDELACGARALELAAEPAADPAAIEAKWPLTGAQVFTPRSLARGKDDSSLRIAVDHDQCILCDRCVRACNEVKENHVIGRSGKGYATHIGFDLDDPMGSSSCVSCGECMISCPTGALVFRELVGGTSVEKHDRTWVDALRQHPLFAGIPAKFLEWNSQSINRRRFRAGEVICHEGEYASTAFVIIQGRVGVSIGASASRPGHQAAGGFKALVRSATGWLQGSASARPSRRPKKKKSVAIDSGRSLELVDGKWVGELTPADVLFGEMACLNAYPRSATVVALEETELLEVNRNVLYMLQRSESSRHILDQAYRSRTLAQEFKQLSMFRDLSAEERQRCAEFLRDRAELVTVDKGQPIFRQGDLATDFYKVRFGFVKVSQRMGEHERVLDYLGPGRTFGEIGLISSMVDLDSELGASGGARTLRVATCTALDTVELVRIRGDDFRAIVERYPAVREELVAEARRLLNLNVERGQQVDEGLENFIGNGLYSAQ